VVRRVSGVLRIWILLAAFAQSALPGVASVVDAAVAAAAAQAGVQAHIESDTAAKCPRVHQEDTCALCRFVSASVSPAPDTAPPAYLEANNLEVAPRTELAPVWFHDGSPSLPRAPPVRV
jgi:hypothetical protein